MKQEIKNCAIIVNYLLGMLVNNMYYIMYLLAFSEFAALHNPESKFATFSESFNSGFNVCPITSAPIMDVLCSHVVVISTSSDEYGNWPPGLSWTLCNRSSALFLNLNHVVTIDANHHISYIQFRWKQ